MKQFPKELVVTYEEENTDAGDGYHIVQGEPSEVDDWDIADGTEVAIYKRVEARVFRSNNKLEKP